MLIYVEHCLSKTLLALWSEKLSVTHVPFRESLDLFQNHLNCGPDLEQKAFQHRALRCHQMRLKRITTTHVKVSGAVTGY